VIAFRCDGGMRVGAGHVARSLQIALAFEAAGTPVVFVGHYDGIAAGLLDAAGVSATRPTGHGALGIPATATAVVVDSYEIPATDVEAAAGVLPVAAVVDEGPVPRATAVLAYHLDAQARIDVPAESVPVLGPDFAPVRPALVAARRRRGLGTALVTAGGGETGLSFAAEAAHDLLALDPDLRIAVAAPEPARVDDERLVWRTEPGGLGRRIAWADVAVTAAGSTPYDLACAGVPMALRAIAPNQEPVAAAFLAAGLAVGDVRDLIEPARRDELAQAGPQWIDGFGAHRARDALRAAFAGRQAPRRLRFRPATAGDADLLLAWRNEPHVREMSRTAEEISRDAHRSWLGRVLADPDRTLLVVEHDDRPVATLRFDRDGAAAEISVTVAPEARGAGLGTQTIAEGTAFELAARPALERVEAEVQVRNLHSLRAFERAGYHPAPWAAGPGSAVLVRPRRAVERDDHLEQEHE
jgi:spore coat polysaccharide biosynthesis predicted glycosyltransferase SpsG/RimJ/RimL family protein N-acetyltransferase